MSDHQKHREAISRKCLDAMSAKGLTFKTLASTIHLSPLITAAVELPQDAAAKASDVLSLPEAEAFLTEIPIRGSLGAAVPTDPTIYRFYETFRSMARRSRRLFMRSSVTAS